MSDFGAIRFVNETFANHLSIAVKTRPAMEVEVGRLGNQFFPAGFYIYTGSAKKNMTARIQRHQKKDKKLRWHIDYLTVSAETHIVAVRYLTRDECSVNQKTPGKIIVVGFGASDCTHGCQSHLKYVGMNLSASLKRLYRLSETK